jgi:hypothetical protein
MKMKWIGIESRIESQESRQGEKEIPESRIRRGKNKTFIHKPDGRGTQ